MTQRAGKRKIVIKKTNATLDDMMDLKIPKSLQPSSPFPPQMDRKLLFHQVGISQGAASFLVYELRCNGAYRPDNATSPPGFAELSQIYNSYKVTHCKVRFNICSNEPTIPIFFGLIYRDVQPSTVITTYTLAVESLSIGPTSGPELVGETQGASLYKSRWYKIMPGAIVGNAIDYYGSTTYAGGAASNPTDPTWVALVMYSYASGTNLANGCFRDVYLEMTTHFYSMIVQ